MSENPKKFSKGICNKRFNKTTAHHNPDEIIKERLTPEKFWDSFLQ